MVTIKCSVYEKHDLLKLLDYAKEKKYQDCNDNKITTGLLELDVKTIETLKRRVNGQYKEDYQDTPAKAYRRQFKRDEDDLDPDKEYKSSLVN